MSKKEKCCSPLVKGIGCVIGGVFAIVFMFLPIYGDDVEGLSLFDNWLLAEENTGWSLLAGVFAVATTVLALLYTLYGISIIFGICTKHTLPYLNRARGLLASAILLTFLVTLLDLIIVHKIDGIGGGGGVSAIINFVWILGLVLAVKTIVCTVKGCLAQKKSQPVETK